MTINRNRLKKKRDIVIILTNTELNQKEMNLFKDGYFDIPKEEIPKSFIIGSIRIFCINSLFIWSFNNEIELGDKIYKLSHYTSEDNSQQCIIYNFDKGWLAPLNIQMSTDKDIKFNVPASTTVNVSISVV